MGRNFWSVRSVQGSNGGVGFFPCRMSNCRLPVGTELDGTCPIFHKDDVPTAISQLCCLKHVQVVSTRCRKMVYGRKHRPCTLALAEFGHLELSYPYDTARQRRAESGGTRHAVKSSMKFCEVSKNLMLDAGSFLRFACIRPPSLHHSPSYRKPLTTPLKSPHPTRPTRKQRSPFLGRNQSPEPFVLRLNQTHNPLTTPSSTAPAARGRGPVPLPTSTRSIADT